MKTLIIKDFKLLTIYNMLLPIISWLLGYHVKTMGDTFIAKILFYGYLFSLIYIVSVQLTKSDVEADIDKILNSLPMNKKNIIRARYLVMLIYTLIISGVLIGGYSIADSVYTRIFGYMHIRLVDLALTLSLVLIFLAFYLPINYSKDDRFKLINLISYLCLMLVPAILIRYRESLLSIEIFSRLASININNLAPILMVLSIILYAASMEISYFLYKKKEF